MDYFSPKGVYRIGINVKNKKYDGENNDWL